MPDFLIYSLVAFAVVVAANRHLRRENVVSRAPGTWLGIAIQALGFSATYIYRSRPILGISLPSLPAGIICTSAQGIIAAASLCLAVWALWVLGHRWSVAAQVVEGHALITTGPYGIVRHPIYAAMFGMLISAGLGVPNLLALLVGAGVFTVGTHVRIHFEERLLRSHFGLEFERYASRVPAFIPSYRKSRPNDGVA